MSLANSPYPAPTPKRRNLFVAFAFGAFISFFLIFFEPFDLDMARDTIYLLGFGGITTAVLIIFLYILPLVWPNRFTDASWTVTHQIVFSLLILFVIATLNGVYTNYTNDLPFSWANYGWIISRTFALGGIPFSFLILIDYHRKNHYNQEMAVHIMEKHLDSTPPLPDKTWTIMTELKSETFTLHDRYFSHAVADGNYIDLYAMNGDTLTCSTYRITLAAFAQQIDASHLQRCHRSYLVNLNRVIDVSGNAQGLQLSLTGHDGTVPVSRKYVPVVRAFFAQAP